MPNADSDVAYSAPNERSFETLAEQLGLEAPAIVASRAYSRERIRELTARAGAMPSEDVSLVVFGSMARLELCPGSDLDWTLLIDGQTQPSHFGLVSTARIHVEEMKFSPPGREGTFGGITSSHDLVHFIGGGSDSNENLTLRLMLLLESAPIGRADAYVRTYRAVLERYISEDFGWVHARNRSNVPRFLQNDVARFWRTMAVDFAYKRRARAGDGWAIRTAKLRLSRKLMYASGLAMCFSCALVPELLARSSESSGPEATIAILSHLDPFVRATPLDVLSSLLLALPECLGSAKPLIESYDRFLAILADDGKRKHLAALRQVDAADDNLYEEVRAIGASFQRELDEIFFSPKLAELSRTYGIF